MFFFRWFLRVALQQRVIHIFQIVTVQREWSKTKPQEKCWQDLVISRWMIWKSFVQDKFLVDNLWLNKLTLYAEISIFNYSIVLLSNPRKLNIFLIHLLPFQQKTIFITPNWHLVECASMCVSFFVLFPSSTKPNKRRNHPSKFLKNRTIENLFDSTNRHISNASYRS